MKHLVTFVELDDRAVGMQGFSYAMPPLDDYILVTDNFLLLSLLFTRSFNLFIMETFLPSQTGTLYILGCKPAKMHVHRERILTVHRPRYSATILSRPISKSSARFPHSPTNYFSLTQRRCHPSTRITILICYALNFP
jgi:hypothetical protein